MRLFSLNIQHKQDPETIPITTGLLHVAAGIPVLGSKTTRLSKITWGANSRVSVVRLKEVDIKAGIVEALDRYSYR